MYLKIDDDFLPFMLAEYEIRNVAIRMDQKNGEQKAQTV